MWVKRKAGHAGWLIDDYESGARYQTEKLVSDDGWRALDLMSLFLVE